jgi:cell surface protein SprA
LAPPQSELYDDAKGFAPARQFEMKNVYFLQARNIVAESLELVIRRRAVVAGEQALDIQVDPANPANNAEYIRILGLDSNGFNTPEPDLIVDPEFLDFEEGTLTFPNITPFAPDFSTVNVISSVVSTGRSSEPGPKLLEYNSILYTEKPTEFIGQNLYQIEARYTTATPR